VEARDRRVPIALGVVLVVALALRIAYVLGQRGDILFDYPVVDEEIYVAMGRRLALGQVADTRAWFQPPGLVYALGAIFRIFGPGLLVPRIVQALVSTASCGLAFVLARRLFSVPVALGAAAVCAVHGVLVFECCELLPPTWMLAADLVALWALLRAKEREAPGAAVGAGAALGVAAVFGPTVFPFALFAAWFLRKPARIAAFVAGMALPIAPVAWGNWQRAHEVVLVSTNGAVNFYIGNNERYDETLAIRPGPHWDDLQQHPPAWFEEQALAFWREHPARALGRYLRKLYLYFDGPEIPRDADIYAMRAQSPLLGSIVLRGPPALPDGLLIPLALVGAAACWADRRKLVVAYAFVVVQALVVAAFFVTSRYRVPAIPVLAMFACAAAERASRAATKPRALMVAGFVVLALLLDLPTREASASYAAELDFYRGMELKTYRRDVAGAAAYLRKAAEQDPTDARFWFELANCLDGDRRTDEAIEAWKRAGELDPWDARARRRAALVLAQRGDTAGAIALYRADIDSRTHDDAYYASDHLTLALLHAKRHEYDDAVAELDLARRADPRWFAVNIGGAARMVRTDASIDDERLLRALEKR
jgi:4-amino-4-deoxy-L-arabinose transferase-like glycosyltransferase